MKKSTLKINSNITKFREDKYIRFVRDEGRFRNVVIGKYKIEKKYSVFSTEITV